MVYRHTTEKPDYSLFSPGGVFYGLPGHPAFPVRLASEMFLECAGRLASLGNPGPYHLFDPCCGGAYHLATLACLHPGAIASITASDIDAQAVALAQRNLSLLTPQGLEARRQHIAGMLEQYGKPSHREALERIDELSHLLMNQSRRPTIRVFQANALSTTELTRHFDRDPPNLVLTDLPYGHQSTWIDADPTESHPPAWRLLDTLHHLLPRQSVLAVAADKAQKIAHPGYSQFRRIKVGHRQVVFLVHADDEN